MIVSARFRPSASSCDHPKVASACAFHATIPPVESMPIKASCAVSTMRRARASLSARLPSACRRSSSAMATTMRLPTEIAKFCSSTVQTRVPPTCSAHNTPTAVLSCRNGTSSMAPMPFGFRYGSRNSRVRGSVLASSAATTRSLSRASKYAGASWRCTVAPVSYRPLAR